MPYTIEFIDKVDYLHVIATGDNTRENIIAYMGEMMAECRSRDCTRVLIEERLEGPRQGVVDVFELISEHSREMFGFFDALAYVDEQTGDLLDFIEDVSVNRGIPVRCFGAVWEAEQWLASQRPGSAKHIFTDGDGSGKS